MPEPPGKPYQIRAQYRLSSVECGLLVLRDDEAALWPAPWYNRETTTLLVQVKHIANVSTYNFSYAFCASITPKPENLYILLIRSS